MTHLEGERYMEHFAKKLTKVINIAGSMKFALEYKGKFIKPLKDVVVDFYLISTQTADPLYHHEVH